jgi:hypothetical protein
MSLPTGAFFKEKILKEVGYSLKNRFDKKQTSNHGGNADLKDIAAASRVQIGMNITGKERHYTP